jgi:hypothetical protein
MKKITVINLMNEFPKEFELEELLERLIFIEKVEEGLKQAQKGQTIEHHKVFNYFNKKWSK